MDRNPFDREGDPMLITSDPTFPRSTVHEPDLESHIGLYYSGTASTRRLAISQYLVVLFEPQYEDG